MVADCECETFAQAKSTISLLRPRLKLRQASFCLLLMSLFFLSVRLLPSDNVGLLRYIYNRSDMKLFSCTLYIINQQRMPLAGVT